MKLNIVTMFVFALLGVAFTLIPEAAVAQGIGEGGKSSVQAVSDAIESNYGLLIGLGVAALGMWMWLIDQNTWGVVMMIGGVAITAFPGLFGGLYEGLAPFLQEASGVEADGNAGRADAGGGLLTTDN